MLLLSVATVSVMVLALASTVWWNSHACFPRIAFHRAVFNEVLGVQDFDICLCNFHVRRAMLKNLISKVSWRW